MTDEELNALADRLDQMGRINGVLTMSLTTIIAVEETQAAASAIRQLMREIKLADFEIQLLKMALADDPMHPLAPS
jgi:hypothetical protein